MKLEDIVARKRYIIPLPPSDIFQRLDETLMCFEILDNTFEWSVIETKGERGCIYTKDMVYSYIINNSKPGDSEDKRIKLENKFYEENLHNETLKKIRNGAPYEISILIDHIGPEGCRCTAKCTTFLYELLSKGSIDEEEISHFMIQESKYEAMNFLDHLFIGVLSGKEIIDPEKDMYSYNFLINNSTIREITTSIDTLLDNATTEILICGWMGTQYLPQLKRLHSLGVNIKFMIHKPGEARNLPWKSEIEEAYKDICNTFPLTNISDAHNIHGRVLVIDNKAIIGSMDLNSSSLTGAHTEYAILTDDPQIVRKVRGNFSSKFKPLKE